MKAKLILAIITFPLLALFLGKPLAAGAEWPESYASPYPSESPNLTHSYVLPGSPTAIPTFTLDAEETQDPSDSPEPYETPEPIESPEPSESPTPEDSPEFTPTATATPECVDEDDPEADLCGQSSLQAIHHLSEVDQQIDEPIESGNEEFEQEQEGETEEFVSYYAPAPFCPSKETITLTNLTFYHANGVTLGRDGKITEVATDNEPIKCNDKSALVDSTTTWKVGSNKSVESWGKLGEMIFFGGFQNLIKAANSYCKGKYPKFPIASFTPLFLFAGDLPFYSVNGKLAWCDDQGRAYFEAKVTITCIRKKC